MRLPYIKKKSPRSWPTVRYCSQCSLSEKVCFHLQGTRRIRRKKTTSFGVAISLSMYLRKLTDLATSKFFLATWLFECFNFQAWRLSSCIVACQSEKSEGFSRKKPKIIVLFGMFFLLPLLFIPFMAFMFFSFFSGNSKIFFHRFHFSLLIFVLFLVAFYSQLPEEAGDTVTYYILCLHV